MHASTTREHSSSRPQRTSDSNTPAHASVVTRSAWSCASCCTQPHAAQRTRGWPSCSFALTSRSICPKMASSSTYSTTCRNSTRPATAAFHSPCDSSFAPTGCNVANVSAKLSVRWVALQMRSTASAPKSGCSSSSPSPVTHASTSSSSSMRKRMHKSRIKDKEFGILSIALGFASTREHNTSNANLLASLSLCTLATAPTTDRALTPAASQHSSDAPSPAAPSSSRSNFKC
mmetsp:Transcript_3840/g.8946  ORF Transcript_3840/g.8946 Transcript_3840/m.8946 type:complete len:232 (-) Transcript_3840:308-1003(-)